VPTPEQISDQIIGMLARNEVNHHPIEGETAVIVHLPPREEEGNPILVFVRTTTGPNDQVMVYLLSPVLQEIPEGDDGNHAKAIALMNFLNAQQIIGRWVFSTSEADIKVEYEMFGNDLSEDEVLNAIATLGSIVLDQVVFLQEEVGGTRPFQGDSEDDEVLT
jgi:hypothetical protein